MNAKKSETDALRSTARSPVAVNDFLKSNGERPLEESGLEPSMTRQEFADDADINVIMARYEGYAADPMRSLLAPEARYLDLAAMPETLLETMQVINEASEAFYRLPASVRKEFDNDALAFTDFAMDPNHIDALREWGLAAPKPAPTAVKTAETPPAAPGGVEPPKAP